MKIGISAPVDCSTFENYLYEEDKIKSKGLGLGGSQVNQIINEFLKRGCTLSIFTLDQSIKVGEEIVLKGESITVYIGAFRRSKIVTLDFQSYERKYLEKVIKYDKPDIVHAHWSYEFALGVINSTVPHLISVRDWAPTILKFMPKPYRIMRFLMNFYVFYKGENFVANSLYIDKKIAKFVKNKFDLIPNAILDDTFVKYDKKFKSTNQIIISINSGFGKLKNVHKLIEAFHIAKKVIPDLKLILIGNNFEYGGVVYHWAKERDLEKGIDFIGEVCHKEILNILETSDLLVHPALEESFGNTLIEAMAKKVPVIGGESSGAVPWVLGDSGILTDVTNENAIAKEIINIFKDENKWYKLSNDGYSRTYSEFRLSVIVDKYLESYKKILGERI